MANREEARKAFLQGRIDFATYVESTRDIGRYASRPQIKLEEIGREVKRIREMRKSK